ncbi:MAG: hypothetical protein BMS9Abin26_0799 [Gammaproteobacteria bacterium]|nr:MAG: hypothetical protein BMS9Abin26_0799 [Gammaproteobacteria bacterium]
MDRGTSHFIRRLTGFLLFAFSINSYAVSFDSSLDLTNLSYTVPYEASPGIIVNVAGALDINRFSLGSGYSGFYDATLTSGNYNPDFTLLGFAITDHPNDALLADPSPLLGIIDGSATFADIFEGSFWRVVWAVPANTTTSMLDIFGSAFQLIANKEYFLFTAGGSITPTIISTTTGINAVPEPQTWLLMLLGTGILLVSAFRKNNEGKI